MHFSSRDCKLHRPNCVGCRLVACRLAGGLFVVQVLCVRYMSGIFFYKKSKTTDKRLLKLPTGKNRKTKMPKQNSLNWNELFEHSASLHVHRMP